MSKAKGAATIEVATLRSALKDVMGVIERRSTVPVLSNVLLSATTGGLSIAGTDLDIEISREAAAQVEARFATTVPAAVLQAIAAKLPADAQATLSLADGKLTVRAGRAKFDLPTLPAEDMPRMSGGEWAATFEMSALGLGAALAAVSHAISTEETRYYLNGVFLHLADGELRFVTTDGHRLARMAVEVPDGAETLPDVILPRKAARVLDALLDRHDGSATVSVSSRKLCFDLGATQLVTKAVDGAFPDYSRVIPTHNDKALSIDRAALIDAVQRVTTVSSDKTRVVKAAFGRDLLTLSVTSPETGMGVEEVPCDYPGDPVTVGLNSRYLLDTLGQCGGDVVQAWLADSAAPTLWRESATSRALFVVMPTRV